MNDIIVLDGDLSLNIPLDGEAESVIKVGHETIVRPISITENGHYEPDAGVDGFSSVDVDVKYQNLINYINEITGGEDDNLSDAIHTLADGYGSSTDYQLQWADMFNVVEIPTNSMSNTVDTRTYFESTNCDFAILLSSISVENQIILYFFGAQYRLRNNTIQGVTYGTAYDAKLVSGSKYLLYKRIT